MPDSYDILIIGGGFSGLGLAQRASYHGFRVLLAEAARLGGGTSSQSLRIVHGGFRYLQSFDLGRVIDSARAKRLALEQYRDLIDPLPCLMPLAARGLRSRVPVQAALKIYQFLTKPTVGYAGGVLTREEGEKQSELLHGQLPNGALLWWDAVVRDPAALLNSIAESARKENAKILENTSVTAVKLEREFAISELKTAAAAEEVRSKIVINAAGAAIEKVAVAGFAKPQYQWCRGFNLVLRRQLESHFALAGHGRGRLLFMVPRDGVSAVGTWYLAPNAEGNPLAVSEEEIASAVRDFNAAFPNAALAIGDVAAVETGLLPIIEYDDGMPLLVAREKVFLAGRYAELLSTKFTTYRVQADRLLKVLAPLLR